jgi:MPBQ/MSBQ methyltransferase
MRIGFCVPLPAALSIVYPRAVPEGGRRQDTVETRVFDAMAASYDELEPWYEHLYVVLHRMLRSTLPTPPAHARLRALDVGCGTGYQTRILTDLGYEAHAIDISAALLAVARARIPHAAVLRADAQSLPYRDASFDAVTCCGSTLSFVAAPARALAEIARVLRPGGRLVLECEHRPSLDLAWALASSVSRDALGYGMTSRAALRALVGRPRDGVTIDYPLPVTESETAIVALRLFTRGELEVMLRAARLRVVRTWGIHMLTNAIPSTVLHRPRLGRRTMRFYRALMRIDDLVRGSRVAQSIANSLVVLAVRDEALPR